MKKSSAKNFSRLRSGLFEKRPRRKTLAGCAANSGFGAALIQAVPRTVGKALRNSFYAASVKSFRPPFLKGGG
ncbi:hypothetical protein B5F10_11660 [Anaerotruncus colihominis]|uniref:Uncharacterized protein n=1 Tax=Anaerotruncus colihominis TaxID=169435 RepID=A0A1Y4MXA2_9FIRM|nr:hypothetical protein B5F11_07685 [Anaerotruncus colihominis]OUP73317.1 hypothetical protein B5F10_11660 [Anaerotruncus colihominis]